MVAVLHLSFEPTWMETLYIVIYPQDGYLELCLYGHHECRSDTLIGSLQCVIADVVKGGESTSITASAAKGGKDRAELLFDLAFWSVLLCHDTIGGAMQAGIVSLGIHEAADLGVVHPYTDIFVQIGINADDSAIHATQWRKGYPNPVWNSAVGFFCQHLSSTVIIVKVIEAHRTHPEIVGHFSLALDDMLESSKAGTQWWPLNGTKSGKIRLSIGWLAVDMRND
ncbi:hypothetical protein AX15_001773 [Amanita polypyramis BW_CC]|nr:hypothetical protein AX15_001773 [Amanita polypyramis BW_CC]